MPKRKTLDEESNQPMEAPVAGAPVAPVNNALAILEQQYRLPIAEQKKLIVMPPNARPSDLQVADAVALARSAGVPLWGINFIPSKNGIQPYINANGIKFRLANDPRKVMSNTMEVLSFGTQVGDLQLVRRTLVMGSGQTYHGLGACLIETDGNTGWNAANAILKADTKANRRAGYDAIADSVGMPLYDEDADRAVNGEAAVEGTYRVLENTPKTIGQLAAWMDKHKVTDEQFLEKVGYPFDEILERNIPAAFEKLST